MLYTTFPLNSLPQQSLISAMSLNSFLTPKEVSFNHFLSKVSAAFKIAWVCSNQVFCRWDLASWRCCKTFECRVTTTNWLQGQNDCTVQLIESQTLLWDVKTFWILIKFYNQHICIAETKSLPGHFLILLSLRSFTVSADGRFFQSILQQLCINNIQWVRRMVVIAPH